MCITLIHARNKSLKEQYTEYISPIISNLESNCNKSHVVQWPPKTEVHTGRE